MSVARSQLPLFVAPAAPVALSSRAPSEPHQPVHAATNTLNHMATNVATASPTSPSTSTQPTPVGTLRLCVLGSGSGGNSTVVQLNDAAMLIDAGFGPRATAVRLRSAKLELSHVRAICLTHLDQDHFRPVWVRTLLQRRIRLILHRWHAQGLSRIPSARFLFEAGLVELFDEEPFAPIDGITAMGVHLPHDRKGTTGFHLTTPAGAIGFATDLGSVPGELVARFAGVDLLAIESNYDPDLQLGSDRPIFLKRRIMGKQGHLSNQQAFDAVRRIVDRAPDRCPQHIVLLHRSRQCNRPTLVQQVFDEDPRLGPRIIHTDQRRRTKWLTIDPHRRGNTVGQLRLKDVQRP